MKRFLVCALTVLTPSFAWAGGFEFPDNGTEALGRGGAFTAKADNGLAIEYNVAGLARQRGTHLLFDANLSFHTYEFQRSGVYPGNSGDANTPYAGMPFPKVANNGGPFFAPFFAVSTDFGFFDRWTFAIGAYGPSAIGNRAYPTTVNGMLPAPQRYDLTKANLLLVFPTIAASVRATRWMDLGLAVQVVYGNFDLGNVSEIDLGRGVCPSPEYAPCDGATSIKTDGVTATVEMGAMFHPVRGLHLGINVRPQVDVNTTGTVTATPPKAQPIAISPARAEFQSHLPWVVRFGARYAFEDRNRFEHGDIEVDATYESWGQAEGKGDTLTLPDGLAIFTYQNPALIQHNYQDTFSIRVGGQFNQPIPHGALHFRGGLYYDSNATRYKDTRLDFDTMQKYGFCAGLGFTIRGISFNLAYAYVYSPDRNVTNGDVRLLNGVNLSTVDATGAPTPVVNNGLYHANTQVVSFGLQVAWEDLLNRHKRTIRYQ